jgi:hypothetical protein
MLSFLACVGASAFSSDVSEIKLIFSIPPYRPIPNVAPSWNVAPTDLLPVSSASMPKPANAAWTCCAGDWYRSGRKTSKSVCTAVTIERSINAAEQPAIVAA